MKDKILQELIGHPLLTTLIICDAAIVMTMMNMHVVISALFVIGLVVLAAYLGQVINLSS